MKVTAALLLSFTCLLVCSQAFAAAEKVYKWTDNKGQAHYSQHPPLNTPTEVIKPPTGHSDPVTYASEPTEKAKADKKDDKTAPAKDKARCDQARQNAETLKTYTHIRLKGDDGEYRFLTPDEQKQKLNEANKAIEESCD